MGGRTHRQTLSELNPYDQSAKLGADTLLEIMRVTKNISALEYMAEELGYKLSPGAEQHPMQEEQEHLADSA
jgi:hypothetical protein